MNNHLLKAFLFGLAALAVAVTGPVLADNDGYWTSLSGKISSGKIWKSGFGECWRTGNWTQTSVDACMGEHPQPVAVATTMQPVAAAPEPVAPVEPRILLTLTGVNFKFDSSAIEPESERILNRAVTELNNAGSVDVVTVGHTDSTGTDAYNMALSHRRANAVKDYLVRHGISSSRLSTEGRGESQPVASNATREGRYQNRRIEFHTTGTMSSSSSQPSSSGSTSSIESWRRLDQTVVSF